MKQLFLLVLFAGAAVGFSSAGQAADKTYFIGRGDLFDGGGNPGGFAGVTMGDDGFTFARTTLVLPEDFRKNSTAVVRFYFVTGAAACSLEVRAYSVVRLRTGKAIETVLGATSGFIPSIGDVTTSPAIANSGFFKDFRLAKPTAGAYTNSQQAGDWIGLTINRVGPADTCSGDLILKGAKVYYATP